MYSFEAMLRKLSKEGLDKFISDLSSGNFSEDAKKELTSLGVLVGGYPNLSYIYTLT